MLTLITKKFTENKEPYTHFDLSKELGIEVLILKDILIELEKMKFINEIIFNKNEESRYQIALNPDTIKIKDYIEKFESKNLGYYDDIFDNLKENEIKVLKDIRENIKIENSKLIKDINN